MSETPTAPTSSAAGPLRIWKRGLWMLLMGLAFHVASMLLMLLAAMQFVLVLLKLGASQPLQDLSRSLGLYLRQIAEFVGFATEQIPFPFAEWPSGTAPRTPDSGPPG